MKKLSTLLPLVFAVAVHAAGLPLVVGMELNYPPFEMTDASGAPAGISVELARALATSLQRPLRIENIAYDGLIPSLKTGKVDLIISSMTATAERARSVDFSEPYLKTGLSLLFHKASTAKTLADLDAKGRTVAVKKGTTGHQYATENLKKARLLVLDKETNCVLEVAQGRADAFIYDEMSTYQNWKRHPEQTRTVLKPFREESWAVALKKGNATLRKQVNAFLVKFRADGGFDRLGDQFLSEEKRVFKAEGIPFYF